MIESPEVPNSEKYFSLHFPYEVNYVFQDGSIHTVFFDYKGNQVEDSWTNLRQLPFDEEQIVSAEEWERRLELE